VDLCFDIHIDIEVKVESQTRASVVVVVFALSFLPSGSGAGNLTRASGIAGGDLSARIRVSDGAPLRELGRRGTIRCLSPRKLVF
jgi:hypothetical protein